MWIYRELEIEVLTLSIEDNLFSFYYIPGVGTWQDR